MKDNSTKKRFKLFDLQKEGKGISKNTKDTEPGLKRFFISYKDNFGKLVSTNIFFILGNFPVIFLIAALAGVTQNEIFLPLSDLFQNLNGIFAQQDSMSPYKLTIYAIEGLQMSSYAPTPLTYVFYGIGALTLVTFGFVNVGTAYIVRNIASGEPVFVWHDFWYAIKRNKKQALIFGIIDAAISALLIYNIYTLLTSTSNFFFSIMFWSSVIIFIVYFFMRYYIYVQMVTFKLSLFKIIKNSLIFSLIGFKRNIMALIGIILLIFIEVLLLFGTGGILVPLAVAAPLAIMFSTFSYMKVYASYFKIKEIMIDPYIEEYPELKNRYGDDDEIIMRDDVTEKERLEEIKRRNGIE
ncbi:MAG: hypothetical protein E7612_06400 [Ruminococcaceae bacterium]|nr:hypothetical protein [Oscillospiraceae bacterium]